MVQKSAKALFAATFFFACIRTSYLQGDANGKAFVIKTVVPTQLTVFRSHKVLINEISKGNKIY